MDSDSDDRTEILERDRIRMRLLERMCKDSKADESYLFDNTALESIANSFGVDKQKIGSAIDWLEGERLVITRYTISQTRLGKKTAKRKIPIGVCITHKGVKLAEKNMLATATASTESKRKKP